MEFCQKATQTPHIDSIVIGASQNDFRSSIESGLNVKVICLMDKHTGSKIDQLDSSFGPVFEKHILRFKIRMNDVLLS